MEGRAYIKELITGFLATDIKTTAFSIYDGQEITNISYPQFADEILSVAGYFEEQNIQGQHIALIAPNSYKWLVTFFAIVASGNVAVPMNSSLPEDLLCWQCQKAEISLICYEDSETVNKPNEIPAVHVDMLYGKECLLPDKLYSHEKDETVIMIFTSGTTGRSKLAELTAGNLFTSSTNMFAEGIQRSGNMPAAIELLTLPLFHIGSIRMCLSRLFRKETVAIGRGARYIFMDMQKLNPTHAGMVPSMAESLLRIMRRTPPEKMGSYIGSNFKSILAVGAAMKQSVAQELLERGMQIEIIYGMTESAGDGAWCVLDKNHIGTIGKPDGKINFCIQDGEILMKSAGVMKDYYKDPEETAKVIVDGWLHTGDMGYCDADGYYYITGRKKNVIILSNGENVNPEEIEATFAECEAVEECLVYSDGKGICADVFAKDQETVRAFIKAYNETMPMYRQVYKVNYTEEPLPKTGSGKIKRKENL